jgi:hypothetical protein
LSASAIKRVVVDKENSTIIEGAGKLDNIKARIGQIRRQIDTRVRLTRSARRLRARASNQCEQQKTRIHARV